MRGFDLALPHGITLACRAAGTPGAPRVMLLHGFPEAAFVWDTLLEHFAQEQNGGFRCVAPNLRGFERSSAPLDVGAYRPRHLVQDIAALITAECGSNGQLACLVAHDWGGAVAWGLAAQRSALLERLVIVNSPHPATFLRELLHSETQQQASAYMNFLCRDDAAALLAANDFSLMWRFFGAEGSDWFTDAVHGYAPPGTERYNKAASELHWERVHSLLHRNL